MRSHFLRIRGVVEVDVCGAQAGVAGFDHVQQVGEPLVTVRLLGVVR